MPEAENLYGNGTGGFFAGPFHPPQSGPAPEDFPGLGRIWTDGANRQKDHPSRFHIGFQLLALHCPSSLKSLVVSLYVLGIGKTAENSS